jgi:hypothetical protein
MTRSAMSREFLWSHVRIYFSNMCTGRNPALRPVRWSPLVAKPSGDVWRMSQSCHSGPRVCRPYLAMQDYWDSLVLYIHAGTYTPLAVVSRARKTTRINHCYDSANSGSFVERGRCDRRCTQHAKIPSGSSLTSDTYE